MQIKMQSKLSEMQDFIAKPQIHRFGNKVREESKSYKLKLFLHTWSRF